jgi:hypothetical protein
MEVPAVEVGAFWLVNKGIRKREKNQGCEGKKCGIGAAGSVNS